MSAPLSMRLDASALTAALNELSEALPKLRERSLEAFNRLVELIEVGPQLATIGLDGAATDASELTLVAQPSQGLLRLVTALRAGDFNLAIVEQALGHGSHPSVGVLDSPTVTESPAGQKPAGDEANKNSGDMS